MSEQPDVEGAVTGIQPHIARSPLSGHEHQHGWGVLACPFESGDVLALRVSPRNDFAPFTSIWHRTPEGAWSIYVDGPRLDVACPRYWSAETEHVQLADISLEWESPVDLVIEMEAPDLRWTASMNADRLVRAVNALSSRLPERVLRSRTFVSATEWICDALFDFGDVTLAMTVPNGHDATVLTRRLYPIVDGSASLDGDDFGSPVRASETPAFGDARLPKRPVFTIGGAYLTITDEREYERTIRDVRGDHETAVGRSSHGSTRVEVV